MAGQAGPRGLPHSRLERLTALGWRCVSWHAARATRTLMRLQLWVVNADPFGTAAVACRHALGRRARPGGWQVTAKARACFPLALHAWLQHPCSLCIAVVAVLSVAVMQAHGRCPLRQN